MDNTCQDTNLLVELIKQKMYILGWNAINLSKKADVAQPVISRLLNGGKNIGIDNIYNILKALDLLKTADSKQLEEKEEKKVVFLEQKYIPMYAQQALIDTKEIILSNHPIATPALLSNIATFKLTIQQDIKIEQCEDKIKVLKKEIDKMKSLEEQSAKLMDGKKAA